MGKYCFGVDVGGTTVKLGLFNTSGDLMEKWEIPTVTEDDGKAILPDCAKSILKKMDERKMDRTEVVGVGIGAPGPVDSEGTLYGAVNLGWGTMSLKKELQTLLNMPVEAGNDANVAALGEAWQGGAKGYEDVVVVTLGTGVGGGIVIDGKIYSGSNFGGAEIGHTVISVDGPQCTCGRKGCFEVYSSATGLIRMTKEALAEHPDSMMKEEEHISGRTAFNYMRKGDAAAKEVVDKYIKYLAAGITNTLNIFQPDVLCIGGGVCNEGDPLLLPMKEIVARENYTRNSKKNAEIVIAKLGNDAGIIGAAFLGNAQ